MTEDRTKRKLSAILSADVKGYSRLMGEDEAATVQTLKAYREVMTSLIQQHRGRVVDSPGDNLLAEFGSVVDALDCAVKIQHELKAKNSELPEKSRMEFRIGVNLGDVIEDEERIYGDGVNVAARVEGLADGGGICVSGTAYDQIAKKLPLGYEYLGEQTVKNIEKPIRVYRVLMEPEAAGKVIGEKRPISRQWRWAAVGLIVVAGALAIWNFYLRPPFEPASVERMAYPLPDKPSIAVLPFNNMSGDPKQEYFSDGITEEIITALSKIPKVLVIARNSTFGYKGKPVKVQQVAEELGVQYVLEGSVRKAEDQVRITAQLIDALSGHHIWAERYDRDLKDIFAVQDEITKEIITALQVELTEGEQALVYGRGTNNLEAYLKVLQAAQVGRRLNQEDNLKARRMAEEAIALDPNYASAYRELGATHLREVWLRITKSPRDSLRRAAELAKKALALDESLPPAHTLLGQVYLLSRAFEKAIAEGQRVIEIDPNGAESHWFLGMALTFAGRPEEAIQSLEKAIRLNPFAPSHYLHIRALSHWYLGQYEEAIEWGEKAVKRTPKDQLSHLVLTMSYSSAGREEEARAQGAKVLKINPKYCVRRGGVDRFKDPGVTERFKNALRKAGVPDCPPGRGSK
jgi:adenylate cyclase